jgi:hypothetical protein
MLGPPDDSKEDAMSRVISLVALCAIAILLTACVGVSRTYVQRTEYVSSPHGGIDWDLEDARQAVKIETAVGGSGRHLEIEYHIPPDDVPQAVRDAMDALYPVGTYVGAEKESSGGELYYELAKEVNGFKVEAMFRPDGTLHEEEIEIPVADVPPAVQDAIRKAWPQGEVTAWEMIRAPNGNITEYHVKLEHEGKAHKIVVTTAGKIVKAFYEIPAEIEVPIPLPE